MVTLLRAYKIILLFILFSTGVSYSVLFENNLARSLVNEQLYAIIGVVGTFPIINNYTRLLYMGHLFVASAAIVLSLTVIFAYILGWWFEEVVDLSSISKTLAITYGGDKPRWWDVSSNPLNSEIMAKVPEIGRIYWEGGHTYLFPTNWFLEEAVIINYIMYLPEFVFLFCLFGLFFHGLFSTTVRDIELDEYPILVNLYVLLISGVFFGLALLFYEINYILLESFLPPDDNARTIGDGFFWIESFKEAKANLFGTTTTDIVWNGQKAFCRLSKIIATFYLHPVVAVDVFVKYTGILCIIQSVSNPLIIYLKSWFSILACLILLVIGCSSFFNNNRLNNYEFAFLFSLVVYSSWILLATVSWLILYLTLELQALCLLILIAWEKNSIFAVHTSLKYGVVNIVASAFFLFGIVHVILLQGDHIINYTLMTLNLHLTRTNTDTFLDFLFNANWQQELFVSPLYGDVRYTNGGIPVLMQEAKAGWQNSELLQALFWQIEYPAFSGTDAATRLVGPDCAGNVNLYLTAYVNSVLSSRLFYQCLQASYSDSFNSYLTMSLDSLYSTNIFNFNQIASQLIAVTNQSEDVVRKAMWRYQELCEAVMASYHYNPTINNPWICAVSDMILQSNQLCHNEEHWLEFFKLSPYRKIMFLSFDSYYTQIYTIALCFILIGLLIKLGAAPLAFWLAEVYAGMTVPVLILFSTLPKLTYIFILFNCILAPMYSFALYSSWYANTIFPCIQLLFVVLAFWSAGLGAKGILDQQFNIFRFLAWSSIINLGFLFLICSFALVPSMSEINQIPVETLRSSFWGDTLEVQVSTEMIKSNFVGQSLQTGLTLSLVFFLYYFIQILFVLGVFNFLYFFSDKHSRQLFFISDLLTLGRTWPSKLLLWVLCLSFLSLFGLPPLAGFWSKFFILGMLLQSYDVTMLGMCSVLGILILNMIGGFGYIRLVYVLIAEQRDDKLCLVLPAVRFESVIFISYAVCFSVWQFFSIACFQFNYQLLSFFDFSRLGDPETLNNLFSILSALI